MASASPAEVATAERLRKDPVWFCRNALGSSPWDTQERIAESVRDYPEVAVASCHGAGKSDIAADIILWFLYAHYPSVVISTAPSDRQVRGVLWKYIGTKHANARVPLGGRCLTQELKIERDWFAWGFTAPEYDPEKFQGFHERHILVVVDEACGVSERIFDGVDGLLSSEHSRLLMIGNPTDADTNFGRSFKRSSVKRIRISAFDTPNFTAFGIGPEDIASGDWKEKVGATLPYPKLVTPTWVADKYEKWGPESPLYIAKVEGRFPESSPDSLIPWRHIEAAQQRTLAAVGDERIGCDPAREGDDKTSIYHRKGPVVRLLQRYGKRDTMETAGWVKHELDRRPGSEARVDEIGIGAGVVDRLDEQGCKVQGVNVGRSARDDEHFANLRAELFWNLRERFEAGTIDIDPHDEDLASQLVSIKWKPDSRGRVMIEKKEDMKKRIGRSPDDAEAVMLAFAEGPSWGDFYGSSA